jgi:periplasmic divalent cation tolerance protein
MQKNYFVEDSYIIVFITIPSLEEAREIAKALVEERLAACVSIIPQIISTYRWQGKVAEYSEVELLVKTKSELFEKLSDKVKKIHSATLPEIISVRMDKATDDYKMWMFDELK